MLPDIFSCEDIWHSVRTAPSLPLGSPSGEKNSLFPSSRSALARGFASSPAHPLAPIRYSRLRRFLNGRFSHLRSLSAPSGFHFRNCPSGFGSPFRFRFARRAVLRIFSQEPFSGAYFINGSIIQDSSIQFICIAYLRILHTCILACYKLLRHPHYEHHQILNQQLPCDYMTLYFFLLLIFCIIIVFRIVKWRQPTLTIRPCSFLRESWWTTFFFPNVAGWESVECGSLIQLIL